RQQSGDCGATARLVLHFINTVTYFNLSIAGRSGYPHREEVPPNCLATAHFALSSRARNDVSWRPGPANIRHRIETSSAPNSCCWRPTDSRTMSLPLAWVRHGKSLASGASVSFSNVSPALTRSHEAGGKPAFPPNVVVEVK